MSALRRLLSDCSYGALKLAGTHPGGLRILMYHRVTDAHPRERLCVSPQAFAEQIRWLKGAGYQTMTFQQAVQWVEGIGMRPQKAVAITFDDGFEDNFTYACPELMRHGFTGAFFIPTDFVASDRAAWAVEDRPMTWQQMNILISHGHEIGAHSASHRKLARLSPEEIHREVVDSKLLLDEHLDRPAQFFCYPAGSYTQEVVVTVKQAGFLGACTVRPGANYPGSDPFLLKRTEISRFDSLWDFQKKMAGAYDWLHAAIQQVHRVTERDHECANAQLSQN